ncbi:hypothetical protein NITGR_810003 [Nitrospina gracilis 3/211]|uniref:Uncharacterized protein n=1 Tax=Nitrospina gracilis (strain 3/211) TaxID=1266370 RepID=M1Z235_NITG3|nr:hypothetical protein NITGR_810003 [Nitrospina gracilis 3/211]
MLSGDGKALNFPTFPDGSAKMYNLEGYLSTENASVPLIALPTPGRIPGGPLSNPE